MQQIPRDNNFGPPNLPKGKSVSLTHLKKLLSQLTDLLSYWNDNEYINGALISVYYCDIIPKSRRLKSLLSKSKESSNSSIVGARFTDTNPKKHIITHYITLDKLELAIQNLNHTVNYVEKNYETEITHDDINEINTIKTMHDSTSISRTDFVKIIVDAYQVENFSIYQASKNLSKDTLITLFNTNQNTIKLLEKIGINILPHRLLESHTIYLTEDQYDLLLSKAPYLVSMAVTDFSKLQRQEYETQDNEELINIPKPSNEPTVGVIDTMFDENVYFSEWVTFENKLTPDIELTTHDYFHGTSVSSIIVDGPSFNPSLDDGCGRFKVKHFGVATNSSFSSFTIIKAIQEIVISNPTIKVWNLSLGSVKEINKNFISAEAAILDKIQSENDVLFVIAGTNKPVGIDEDYSIGSPADSINSLVVNSVNKFNKPASYTRDGLVLSFFNKPDVSYYGGDNQDTLKVCTPTGEANVIGTSFAAPWITRKVAYLIEILGFSKEEAKAIIIDSATGWEKQADKPTSIGYGVVPIRIEDIVNSQEDEIKFILSNKSDKYETSTFNIPIPYKNDKHPFLAKATLCYFPKTSRNQGVDYTNTELDIKFGRIDNNDKLKSINNNYQDEQGYYTNEENARKAFRKWDNVKHISEVINKSVRDRKAYDSKLWGLSIKSKERLDIKHGEGMKFSVVIRLKEIHGKNRINEFIQACNLRGWLVNEIQVDNRIDIYETAEEEINFE